MDANSDRVAPTESFPTSVLVASAPHATSSHARTAQASGYQRRRPEATALHRIVREHRATLFSDAAARSASGRGYPRFVVEEFDKYERCGILAYGVVRVYCETCRQSDVVAFSCKGRALCLSCTGRRMADVTTHLVDAVLPVARYRQWTLTFPWTIRVMLVQHPSLVTALQKIMVRRIERFLRRRARDHGLPRNERAHTGAIVAIQRFGSRLNLHIHCHAVIPDAVWALRDGALVTVDLPPPTDEDVDTIVRDICRRVAAYIERRTDDGTLAAPTTDDDCDDARDLAQLVLTDTIARKPSILDDFPAAAPTPRKLTAQCDGFSLECKPSVAAADRAGLERLLRYGARPAFAHDRVEQLPNGNVSYRLPKAFYTGQTHVVLPPVEFLRRLAALIPPPRFHTIRYHGLFAPNAKLRPLACALAPNHITDKKRIAPVHGDAGSANDPTANPDAPYRRRTRMLWSQLLRRVFAVDVLRCPCGADADRKLIGVLSRAQTPDALDNFLRAIGESTVPPPRAKARPPPQVEMF